MPNHFNDLLRMPDSGELPSDRLGKSTRVSGTTGGTYVERRGVSISVAECAGVRFDADFCGRPAVLVPLRNKDAAIVSVHGRYLHNTRNENKMLTIGQGGGVINFLGGWRVDPLVLVEGLFDGLSLAMCGWSCVATIGRWAPWLPEVAAGRKVLLAFDASRSGDAEASAYAALLEQSLTARLMPPNRCKDWNTAIRKVGRGTLTRWLDQHTDSKIALKSGHANGT